MTAEPAGANCTHGGTRVDGGLDANANGVLDAGEVSTTSYVCHAPTGAVRVTGESQAMQANRSYVADSASSVAFTMPTAPAIGDTIELSGAGVGGWNLALDLDVRMLAGGGYTLASTTSAVTETPSGTGSWNPMAANQTGDVIFAANQLGIRKSSDGGATWSTALEGDRNWRGISVSADGQRVVAVSCGSGFDGVIQTSSDGGAIWATPAGAAALGGVCWERVGMSDDGQRILLARDFGSGSVYVSSNGGASFTQVPNLQPGGSWVSASVSANGMKMIASQNATVGLNATVVSIDGGATWSQAAAPAGMHNSAVSADGSTMIGITHQGTDNRIYTSTDNGATWTSRLSVDNGDLLRVALSANGRTLAASTYGGATWTSSNGGDSWAPVGNNAYWYGLAVSGGGTKVYSADVSGTYQVVSTTFVNGMLWGNQYSWMRAQYVAPRTWLLLNSSGVGSSSNN